MSVGQTVTRRKQVAKTQTAEGSKAKGDHQDGGERDQNRQRRAQRARGRDAIGDLARELDLPVDEPTGVDGDFGDDDERQREYELDSLLRRIDPERDAEHDQHGDEDPRREPQHGFGAEPFRGPPVDANTQRDPFGDRGIAERDVPDQEQRGGDGDRERDGNDHAREYRNRAVRVTRGRPARAPKRSA
jgi:hypothetical protein